MDSNSGRDQEWEEGWEGHERAQRRRLSRLPLATKLQWLEEAQRVIEHLRRSRQDSVKDDPKT